MKILFINGANREGTRPATGRKRFLGKGKRYEILKLTVTRNGTYGQTFEDEPTCEVYRQR